MTEYRALAMQREQKKKIDKELIVTEKKIFAREIKAISLDEFKKCQKEKRKQLRHMSQALTVKQDILTYLKSHNIYFETDVFEGITRIVMAFRNCDRCPGKITEGCIYFYDDCMEIRVYYSELGTQICNESKNLPDFYRLMNYMNALIWPCVADGMDGTLYNSEHLVSPRFIVTEDGMKDITTIMAISYSHFKIDALQIENYITAALPNLLDSLSIPIFLLLAGRINVENAINMIETEIHGKGEKT